MPANGESFSAPPPPASKAEAQRGSQTILVVEDEPLLRKLMLIILELWDHCEGKIDLLLTDMVRACLDHADA